MNEPFDSSLVRLGRYTFGGLDMYGMKRLLSAFDVKADRVYNGVSAGKKNSIALTEGPSRAAARSYLRAVGFSKEDLHKPIIGVANTWTEIGTCNFHLRDVAKAVKQGVREAGGTPMEFNTITIHDRYAVTLFYQAFNMTNRANYGPNYDGNVSNASSSFLKPLGFINPSSTVVPRSFTGEFGARFSF